MNKDDFLKMASDDQYLSGIYNYCDRWCEKCPFTSRCLNYTALQELGDGKDISGLSLNESFDIIKDIFDLTAELLEEFAEKEGIDLSEIDDEEYSIEEEVRRVEEHPLSVKAAQYFHLVYHWLNTRDKIVKSRFDEYLNLTEMGFDEDVQFKKAEELNEALEIIRWYYTFIRVKINSALNIKYFENLLDDPEHFDEQLNIAAKLALIGCSKSLEAWNLLYKILDEDEDELLKILAYLKNLSNEIRKEFPSAEAFKRPYFE